MKLLVISANIRITQFQNAEKHAINTVSHAQLLEMTPIIYATPVTLQEEYIELKEILQTVIMQLMILISIMTIIEIIQTKFIQNVKNHVVSAIMNPQAQIQNALPVIIPGDII